MTTHKESYYKQIETKLRDWGIELDQMKTKASEVQGEAKSQYNVKIEQLSQWRDQTQNKLAELRKSGDANWQTLKTDVDEAISSLEQRFSEAKESLSKSWGEKLGDKLSQSSSPDAQQDKAMGIINFANPTR